MTNSKAINVILIIALVAAIAVALLGPPPPAGGAADRSLKSSGKVKLKNNLVRYRLERDTYAYEPVIDLDKVPFKYGR